MRQPRSSPRRVCPSDQDSTSSDSGLRSHPLWRLPVSTLPSSSTTRVIRPPTLGPVSNIPSLPRLARLAEDPLLVASCSAWGQYRTPPYRKRRTFYSTTLWYSSLIPL